VRIPSQYRCICFDFTKKCRPFFIGRHVFIGCFWGIKGKFGQIWEHLGKNGVWSALIWKNTPNNMERNVVVFVFFNFIFFGLFFGQVCGNLGKNPSHPQKFACSYACAQTCWSYTHAFFWCFRFVISDLCLLFGWMLFLAESLSSLRKYFFLVRYTVVFI